MAILQLPSTYPTAKDIPDSADDVGAIPFVSGVDGQLLGLTSGVWAAVNAPQGFSGDYNDLSNKPTAADVGALPLIGGTVTGTTRFTGNVASHGSFQGVELGSSGAAIQDNAGVWLGDYTLAKWVGVHAGVPSVYDSGYHDIYHEGNKPSASDVGALPLGGGTLTGPLTVSGIAGHGIKSSNTWFDIDGSSTTEDFRVRFGRNTNTSGDIEYVFYRGDGTSSRSIRVNPRSEYITIAGNYVYHEGNKPKGSVVTVENPDHGDDQAYYILNPEGGTYSSGSSSNIGYLVIEVPTTAATFTMMGFTVCVYYYGQDEYVEFDISGYYCVSEGTAYWSSALNVIQKGGHRALPVSAYGAAAVGEGGKITIGFADINWSYAKAFITKAWGGYNGVVENIASGWNIEVSPTPALGTHYYTQTNRLADHRVGNAQYYYDNNGGTQNIDMSSANSHVVQLWNNHNYTVNINGPVRKGQKITITHGKAGSNVVTINSNVGVMYTPDGNSATTHTLTGGGTVHFYVFGNDSGLMMEA